MPARGPLFDQEGLQPLGPTVDRGGHSGGASADNDNVVEFFGGGGAHPQAFGQFGQFRIGERAAVLKNDQGELFILAVVQFEELLAAGAAGVDPLIGLEVSRQPVLDVVAFRGILKAHYSDTLVVRAEGKFEVLQQLIQHGIEFFLRRVPGLKEIVVELNVIDRLNGRLGVGVGGKQRALGVREKFFCLLQEIYPQHFGHALVGKEQRNGFPFLLQLRNGFQGLVSARGTDDAVVLLVLGPQIALQGAEDLLVVVDG